MFDQVVYEGSPAIQVDLGRLGHSLLHYFAMVTHIVAEGPLVIDYEEIVRVVVVAEPNDGVRIRRVAVALVAVSQLLAQFGRLGLQSGFVLLRLSGALVAGQRDVGTDAGAKVSSAITRPPRFWKSATAAATFSVSTSQ